jgi:hypothetical protein
VLDIILEMTYRILFVKEKYPNILEEVSYIQFYFILYFLLGGEDYVMPSGTVITGILDMRAGKHDLHFLVGAELLPHAFVNIPNKKMNIGVFLFIFNYYYLLCFF